MKSRIAKIALYAALAAPVSYGTVRVMPFVNLGGVIDKVTFYADIPSRVNDAVSNFKRLPERMNPTCSECNEP